MPLLNEAMFAVMEGVATPAAIDEVFKLGMAHPMGPLALADFIGLDVCLDIMRVLQEGLGDPKYRPCPCSSKWWMRAGWARRVAEGFMCTKTALTFSALRVSPHALGILEVHRISRRLYQGGR